MNNILFKILVGFLFVFGGCATAADETFWLSSVAAPYKVPKNTYPVIEDYKSDSRSVYFITIKNNRMIFNGDMCNYDIKEISDFRQGRALTSAIDDAGGQKKFELFVKKKLGSDFIAWSKQYFMKKYPRDINPGYCDLLQSGSIYRGKNELIIWDTTYFYRFVLGVGSATPDFLKATEEDQG